MKKKLYTLLALFYFSLSAFAQPNLNDPTFNTYDDGTYGDGSGFSNTVNSISIQADGKIIVGGNFSSFNGTVSNRIANLNADGSLDTGFNLGSGFNGTVWSTSIQADGKIIVGGQFTSFNGTAINRIARLNADGSLDTGFNLGSGFNNTVWSTSIQADGKIIVGGAFTSFNGTAINRIARLNIDGSLDTDFNLGTGFDNGIVYSTSIQADGRIIAGGSFTSFNGTAINRIIRLNSNGSLHGSFFPGSGFNNDVRSIFIQADGRIIAGGNFTSFNGTLRNRIARLNTNGSLDAGFNPGSGFNNDVRSIFIQADGRIIAGGNFTSFNGTLRNRIARLNADGSMDSGFNPGSGFNDVVNSISIQSDGKIIVGGSFWQFNETQPRYRITRLNSDGSLDYGFNPGAGVVGGNVSYPVTFVSSTSIQADGKIIIGGHFSSFNDTIRNYIARLNPDGSLDNSFNPGSGFNNTVSSTSIQADGKVIVGGQFSIFNGTAITRIARLNANGSLDAGFTPGTQFNNTVHSTSIQSDGKIIVGGSFNSFNGAMRICRLNANGLLDSGFNPGLGFNNTVRSTSIQADGKIIVGGDFTTFDGTPRNYIARLNADGSLDSGFNPGLGFNNAVSSISIQADGKIIVGGSFTTFDGTPRNYIARLNADGSLDTSFNPGSGFNNVVSSISIQANGKIIVGGIFISFDGIPRNYIARLNADGSLDTGFEPGTLFDNQVISTSIQADGKIIVGGQFTNLNGTGKNRIARLLNCFSNTETATISACGDYTWIDGITYTASNNSATWTLINSDGCDSIVTLNLTITNPTLNSTTASACDSYTWAENGQTYTTSGTYTVVSGCHTDELVLTITNPTTNTTTMSACDSYTWAENGQTYTTSGTYTVVSGCHTDELVLTITNPTTNTTTISACDSYIWAENGQTYTTSGTYTVVDGCHTEELVLTINQVSDLTLTLLNETLTANLSGASYQWLDCDNGNATIAGANNQSYTATANGNYAVEITQNSCTATSDCYLVEVSSAGLNGTSNSNEVINLYPNPNNGLFTLETSKPGKYFLLDGVGKQIFEFDVESPKNDVHIPNISKGVYYIMYFEEESNPIKLIVH